MITRITKENRAKYVKLFAKATEALKAYNGANYPEDFTISSLEEYFQNIEELFNLDPQYVRLPLDEETFDIDLNTRQITIPASFKKSGLGVQNDDLAETIYFKTDRYFDMVDLNNTCIVIQWEAPNGKKMASPAFFQEVDSETDKLIFGWAITKSMTTVSGTLKFSVAFIEGEVVNDEEDELNIEKLEYRLGTLTNSININAGLNIAQDGKVVGFENRLVDLKNRIKNTPILDPTITDGDPALILDYNGFAWNDEHLYKNIFTDLMDDPETDEKETGIPMLAVSPGAGLISYEFFKEGKTDPLYKGPGAIRYIKVTKDTPKREEAIYFIKEGKDDYRYFDDGKDYWYVDNNEENGINPLLYEKIAFLPINAPGTYYAKVTNKEGKKIRILDTRKYNGLVGVAVIPAPTEINAVVISSKTDTFSEEKPVVISSGVSFKAEEDEEIYQNLKYQWCKRVAAEDGSIEDIIIEDAKEANYQVSEIGDYVLKVYNDWNKAQTDTITSENVIRVYLAAVEPEITSFKPAERYGIAENNNAEIAAFGENNEARLIVEYKPIEQAQAKQYVHWMFNDADNEDDWVFVMKKDENGNDTKEFYEGKELIATAAGDYKAIVYNYITKDNQKSVSTDKGLSDNDWFGKIIRVVKL